LADVQRKLKWALSIVYSRSMLLPVLVDEPKEATEGHSHKAKKAREAVDTFRRQAESTEQQHHAHHPHGNHKHKIRSPLFGATREERGAESEVSELSIVPLLDLVNHADEGIQIPRIFFV
jgi:FtsZ-binding cell division protein ZapB